MFGEGSFRNLEAFLAPIDKYSRATGMVVNVEKFNLIHNEFLEELLQRSKELIQYQTTSVEEGFKYLGFTLKPNCYRYHDSLYKKNENIINIWEKQFLSIGGRLILLKSVLQSIPIYWDTLKYCF